MCYIFKSLKANRLLAPGDTIALGTPIFTPYIEMTHLEDYDLKVVNIRAPQENRFQYTDEEIKKLEDPKIKAFFVVNPGNPSGMALSKETIAKITALVRTKRPDLMLLTDDVYGTFVNDFRSLLGELPHNTIGVYSYSKYFGCTGWRLGVIAVHEDNIYDKMIAKLPGCDAQGDRQALRGVDAGAARAQVHRPHRRRQPRRGAQPHCGIVVAAAGHDEPVLVVRIDGRRQELSEGLHGDRPAPHLGDDRRPRSCRQAGAEPELRRLLRPDRFRILGAQEHRRRRPSNI